MVRHHHDLKITTERQYYLPGDEVIGTVNLTPKKMCAMNFVKISFFGEEFCHWNQAVNRGTYEPLSKTIFKKDMNLVTEKTRFEMQPYSWNFRFTIPRNIPPTCNIRRKNQYILYELRATCNTGFGHFDEKVKLPIVIGQVWVPPPPVPSKKTHKTLAGDIRMEAICNATVASVGDEIRCAVNFRNNSSKSLVGLRMKLKQTFECESFVYHKIVVCKKSTKEGFPLTNGNATKMISMVIPRTVQEAPTIKNASFFKCQYTICLYGVTKMAGMIEKGTVKVKIPIIISRNPEMANTGDAGDDDAAPDQPVRIRPVRSNSNSNTNNEDFDDASMTDLMSGLGNIANWANNGGPVPANRPTRSASGTFIEDFNYIFNNPVLSHNNSHINAQGEIDDESAFAPAADDALNNSDDEKAEKDDCDGEHDHDHEKSDLKKSTAGECVVCFDGAKNMLLLPCAHISTCYTCTTQIMKTTKNCPVCRSRITQIVRTYRV